MTDKPPVVVRYGRGVKVRVIPHALERAGLYGKTFKVERMSLNGYVVVYAGEDQEANTYAVGGKLYLHPEALEVVQ